VSAFGASERVFMQPPSMTKAQRSFTKKVQKNLRQFIHKQNTYPRLDKLNIQQVGDRTLA
jgi:hypothetical protein